MSEIFDIPESNFFEVIVIGGGPCGLAVSARLCEETPGAIFSDGEHQRFHWLRQRGGATNIIGKKQRALITSDKKFKSDEILVLDKVSDKFMGQWDNQFDTVKIPYLRSPMFFHPDPLDIDGLTAFAYSNGREKELMEINGVVGQEITKHQQKKMRNKRKLSHGSQSGGMAKSSATGRNVGLVEIDRRNWKDYYRPSTKLFADFCQSIVDRYHLQDVVRKADVIDIRYGEVNKIMMNGEVETGMGFQIETSDGEIFGSKVCINAVGPAGEMNYPLLPEIDNKFPMGSCHTSHLFQKQVQVPNDEIMSKIQMKKHTEVVVVGGGLTSAQLTEKLIQKGISKVHFVTRGEIKIKHFDFHLEWVSKYQNYMKSTFWMKDSDEERYQMIEDAREGGSVNPQYHKVLMDLISMGKVELHKHCEISDKEWDEMNGVWSNVTIFDKRSNQSKNIENIDYIVYATGTRAHIEGLPMMKSICESYPIDIIRGVPCLTDDLQWNDEIPLFFLGRFAMLKTGPSSANLDGARIGAERVGWYIQHLRDVGKLKYDKTVSIDGKIPTDLIKSMENENGHGSDIEDKDEKQGPSGFENLLSCTGGRFNWYTFLDDVAA